MIYKVEYSELTILNNLISDYLKGDDSTSSLYNLKPSIDSFAKQIELKNLSYTHEQRVILCNVLRNQYSKVDMSSETMQNIDILSSDNTYTITTGHQLNIFTGPVFFIYKIISVINLCNKLSKKYPESNFVPVFWMASEDNDFDEINNTFTPEYASALLSRSLKNMDVLQGNIDSFVKAATKVFKSRRIADQVGTMLAGTYLCYSTSSISPEEAEKWIKEKDWSDHTTINNK